MTGNVTSAERAYAAEEMQKTYESPKKYQVEIPAKIKKEVGLYARDFGTASAIKKFTIKYSKYILSEPQLTPGRRTSMMMTEPLSRELADPTC